ncbi:MULTISPECIES: conjugative transfer protein MobI(A/C) [Aeromonas]|nr:MULTISPECIES: conjugative transfer protein MobI(A/C) [Aeromonas]MDU4190474.1 conjugative transfer protein MobI(A/C) [Aeromonas sp.]
MKLPTARWLELLDPDLEDERSEITADVLAAEREQFVSEVRKQLDHALAVLALEAQQESDMYWSAHNIAREDAGEDEQGRVGTRIRIIRKVTLSVEWYRNRFVSAQPNEKKLVFSTYIKKGKSHKYSMANFKNEPQWAQELIQRVESRYARIRQRASALTKVRRALNEYERLLDKTHSDEV